MKQDMRHLRGLRLLALLAVSGLFSECATSKVDNAERFVTQVKPTLEYYCIECHTDRQSSKFGELSLESGNAAMNTGRHKPVIIPGNPEGSLLYHVLRFGHESPLAMPPSPDGVSDEQLEAIRVWIAAGAHWPMGPSGRLALPH